ncbi:hypothetical protein DSO57_1032687 [Entomophthora muscae]|uniref:Uncharacterized protein n=1 Tax=Entomophthora muscae TaxID=34485 RepID=A0ACC2T0C5_9FUNG|nr:hypothetical protein DSO57_1032687 [Entomophthora muscae]
MFTEVPTPRPKWLPQASAPLIDEKSLRELYPNFLELKQLIIIHRHGERTPLSPSFPGFLPSNWNFCESGNKRISRLSPDFLEKNTFQDRSLSYFKVPEVVDTHKSLDDQIIPKSILNVASCTYGQLTDIGRRTLERNGRHLRSIYAEYLNFLPPKLAEIDSESLYLRTTDCPRTAESLQHLLVGLFPDFLQSKNTIFRTRTFTHDSLLVDFKCNQISTFRKAYLSESESLLKEKWEKLRKDLIANTALGSVLANPKYDGAAAIHHVYDSMSCAYAHGLALPDGFTPKHMETLNTLEVELRFGAYFQSPQLSRISIGRLFSELKSHLSATVDPSKAYHKLAVYSGHDATLGPLLIGMQGFDNIWPAFGTMVMFELFKDSKLKDESIRNHYVRVKYNDKVIDLPQCKPSNQHHPELGSTFCKLSAIFDLFQKNIPVNYPEECAGFSSEFGTHP